MSCELSDRVLKGEGCGHVDWLLSFLACVFIFGWAVSSCQMETVAWGCSDHDDRHSAVLFFVLITLPSLRP